MPPRRATTRPCGAACAAAILSTQHRIDDALRNNSLAPVRRDAFHPYERCLLEALKHSTMQATLSSAETKPTPIKNGSMRPQA